MSRRGRIGDMDTVSRLVLFRQDDGDIIVQVNERTSDGLIGPGSAVEFCAPGTGGGHSPAVHRALVALWEALADDNASRPAADPFTRTGTAEPTSRE